MPILMIHSTLKNTFTACVYHGQPPESAAHNRVHQQEISQEDAKLPIVTLLELWKRKALVPAVTSAPAPLNLEAMG